jgi:hypothetical protein
MEAGSKYDGPVPVQPRRAGTGGACERERPGNGGDQISAHAILFGIQASRSQAL